MQINGDIKFASLRRAITHRGPSALCDAVCSVITRVLIKSVSVSHFRKS